MEVIVCEGESSSYDQPDKKVYEGHTGNAGPTLEYRYHRAMVVVWPTFLSHFVACKVGLLESVLESNDMGFDDSLHKIIDRCEENHREVWTYSREDSITV